MIEWMARWTARKIKNSDPDSSEAVMEYSLKIIYNSLAIIIICLLIGIITQNLINVIVVMFSFALFRFFTGGMHIKSSDLCVIVSVGLITLISVLNFNYYMNVIFFIISLTIIIILAPKGVQLKIDKFTNSVLLLKITAIILLSVNYFFVQSELINLTFFVQSLTLLFKGEK